MNLINLIIIDQLGNSFPGCHFPGARDSRTFSFPISREWKRLDSREIGKSEQLLLVQHCRPTYGRFDGCCSRVLVLHVHGEDDEFNHIAAPPLSTCSWSLLVHWCWLWMLMEWSYSSRHPDTVNDHAWRGLSDWAHGSAACREGVGQRMLVS